MKFFKSLLCTICVCSLFCCTPIQNNKNDEENAVIETIMTRRSVRKYQPQAVNRDTMQVIMECGINAPNAINRQAWEVRVLDNPETIQRLTELYVKENPKEAENTNFRNMFRNAPTIAFIANDTTFAYSPVDCGLMAENMILSAWSMGIGSCCLGGPARFMKANLEANEILKQMGFSENYDLLLCIGFGYPAETPAAKPREVTKVKFLD
ncbi:MAG: nitroreductase family protein [Bacteroidaceae bacterium]|nr:nitroreductase family protein [Bacteroidaceae bacterium]